MRIAIAGSGNVATHLGLALHKAGHDILCVYSRAILRAKALADRIGAVAAEDAQMLAGDTDVVIIAVRDDAIDEVSNRMVHEHEVGPVVVHTAGSVPMTTLSLHRMHGVLWPVQTFTSGAPVDMQTVPFAITGNSEEAEKIIAELARSISPHIYPISDDQRAVLHIAATFANNFGNHMFHLSQQIAESAGVDFNLLRPLILETARKVQQMHPYKAQTGAALRGDIETMEHHLSLLKGEKTLAEIYKILSRSIREAYE